MEDCFGSCFLCDITQRLLWYLVKTVSSSDRHGRWLCVWVWIIPLLLHSRMAAALTLLSCWNSNAKDTRTQGNTEQPATSIHNESLFSIKQTFGVCLSFIRLLFYLGIWLLRNKKVMFFFEKMLFCLCWDLLTVLLSIRPLAGNERQAEQSPRLSLMLPPCDSPFSFYFLTR